MSYAHYSKMGHYVVLTSYPDGRHKHYIPKALLGTAILMRGEDFTTITGELPLHVIVNETPEDIIRAMEISI